MNNVFDPSGRPYYSDIEEIGRLVFRGADAALRTLNHNLRLAVTLIAVTF